LDFGSRDDLPGEENERFLEYWNLVFMQFNQQPANVVTSLPAKNIDTGLGLNRLAAIVQDKPSVFETDQFWPLIELGQSLSGRRYGADDEDDRALRVLADHSRAMTFLIADGVVPSNEDRGYVLRRIIRRAFLRGRHHLSLEPGFLERYAAAVTELMGAEYPELHQQREAIALWLSSEEESFGRTLEQGTRMLDELIARARDTGAEGIAAPDAFMLHDTYGFPFDLTLELVTEQGLGVDEEGFEALMEEQRKRSRYRAEPGVDELRKRAADFASQAGFETDFVGYRATDQVTTVGALVPDDGRVLAKLVESPFYATGGGQVADSGYIECADGDCHARVDDVLRLGDDQVVALIPERGELKAGERIRAHVDRATRRATECNHTATHLLHAALRRRLGNHVRQAGSYVGPDKLRFDFTHGRALTREELSEIEDDVNRWILEDQPVRALTTTLAEARRLGAMALFGEKYGDVVRMVEVGDGSFSRELCGGTHVRFTAEIGAFRISSETSSARNVRRVEALTGPAAIGLLREHDRVLGRAGELLRVPSERVADAVSELQARPRTSRRDSDGSVDIEPLLESAVERDGARVLVAAVSVADGKALLELADRLKARLGDAAIVLGSAGQDRVDLIASVAPSLVARQLRAGEIVKAAAAVAGGGGGGRDTLARAGGRDPAKLPAALEAAREAIEAVLIK
jgi:alanyl-tRNA synthetase